MKKILLIITITAVFLSACKEKSNVPLVQLLNTSGSEALGPYLTKNNKGIPVLCWTEQDGKDSLFRLKYAVYNVQSNKFGVPVIVPTSAGCSNSAESMGKIAFKADGTVMAIFSKRFTDEKNPYAGAIFYSFSADQGRNWSDAQFLHSDTAHTYGRSFFDIATLKDGELAAVWLDGRFGKSIKGSALFFNRTEKGRGFGTDSCLDKGTCECCRTDILTDYAGNIHIAYRNISFPSALANKQVRDMAYIMSADNGKTFSKAKTISADNWQIEGCPHSGPSLAETKSGIDVVWFTAGGGAGLYKANAAGLTGNFGRRALISSTGRHPQMISLTNDRLAMVCEELNEVMPDEHMNMDHSHHGMSSGNAAASDSKIFIRILNGEKSDNIAVTDGHRYEHHAVLTQIDKKELLVAWIREDKGHSEISYSRIYTD